MYLRFAGGEEFTIPSDGLVDIQTPAMLRPALLFQDNCDLTSLKENVADALNKLIDLDIVFARYTPFLVEER
jgi:hypothetical protein